MKVVHLKFVFNVFYVHWVGEGFTRDTFGHYVMFHFFVLEFKGVDLFVECFVFSFN